MILLLIDIALFVLVCLWIGLVPAIAAYVLLHLIVFGSGLFE